ncbi:hypothetical protein HRbin17_01462 [bacterium HR17]|jgi:predicted TIM-barrel fold metal-dependent hydrolase|uniref:Amidohydrolase-related domain-containing protein n=1 Tax=Candidatus Fervidibacter japonicus TaxID=2035412 RepID=A0A2H5XCN8_9BACT|nr:hypothetical protein HRbin17_01462 [bacterium HR17]
MPIVDAYAELGWWTLYHRDGDEIEAIARYADRYGMTTVCIASAEALRGDLQLGNRKIAELVRQHQRLKGYVVVNPNHPEESAEDMKRYLGQAHFVGIVLPPPSLAYALSSWRTVELVKMARRYDVPFVAFAETAEDAQGLVALTKAFAGVRFVMVPLQGCDWWAALKIVAEVANIAVVVSGLLTERGIAEQAIALLGERRVLFGSGMTRFHPACGLGIVYEAELTERQRAMVLETNARQWLLGV